MPHRAPGVCTASGRHDIRVSKRNGDALKRNTKKIRGNLREACLMALPRRLRPDHNLDTALGVNRDIRTLTGRSD